MDIYFIRHAEALPQDQGFNSDEERPLSEEGLKQATNLAQALKMHGVKLDTIVTSPLVRAQQTADILRTVLGMTSEQVETCDGLAPDGRPKKLARCVNGLQCEAIALVGHQPDLSQCVGWLIGEKEAQIRLTKCGVAVVGLEGSFSKGAGVLNLLLSPKWT